MGVTSVIQGQTIFRNSSLAPSDFDTALIKCVLLEGLSIVERKQILKSAPKRLYSLGEQICERGTFGHSFYVIVSGAVELGYFQEIPLQERRLWQSHKTLSNAGESFGEESLIAKSKRSYSAVATMDSTAVIEIDLPLFTRLDALVGGKLSSSIEDIQKSHLVLTSVSQNLLLKDLTVNSQKLFAKVSELYRLNRGDSMIHDEHNLLFVIDGLLSVEEETGQTINLLVFLNKGDLFTGGHPQRTITLQAKESTTLVTISESVLKRIPTEDQRLLHSLALTPPISSQETEVPNTVFQFVQQMVDEGAQQGLSLLSIDLDHCVRCGQCVRSCEARHGHAKMTRRGRTVRRRRDIKVEGDYQAILLPSSCRHCSSPECMVGCPTSAIHRGVDGEIDIKDTCIGCASCANRCPYGNITMVPTPNREVSGAVYELKASKCNLCSGYNEPNCVNNCPTGAMIRVEPQQYFEEFAHLVKNSDGNRAIGGGSKTIQSSSSTKRSKRKFVHVVLTLASLIVASLGGWISYIAPSSVWSKERMLLGGLTALFMIGAGLLAGRRRWASKKSQFGQLYIWTQAHLYMGALSLLFMIYHTGGQVGSGLTLGLWSLTWLEVIVGIFGWGLYRILPRILTNLEGGIQVEEDAIAESQIISSILEDSQNTNPVLINKSPSLLQVLRGKEDVNALHDELEKQVYRLKQLQAYILLHKVRRGWLILHLGLSCSLVVVILTHIATVL